MQDTINFAIELDPLIANFSMMTPYPGTKVYEIVNREGKLLMTDWEDYVFFEQKARYEMGEMTAEVVEDMYRKAYRQFYLRPRPSCAVSSPKTSGSTCRATCASPAVPSSKRKKRPSCAG